MSQNLRSHAVQVSGANWLQIATALTLACVFASSAVTSQPTANGAKPAMSTAEEAAPSSDQTSSPSSPQSPSSVTVAPEDFEFDDVVNVRIKNVIVYVRDKKGNPVRGLKAEDFRLLEDRREMPISNFYEMVEGQRSDMEEVPQLSQLERIKQNPDADPRFVSTVPEDQRLYLTIYIDHQNIRPQNRNRVFRDLRAFLREHVTREDRVQLVTYARSVKVVREWTSDSSVIAQGLFEEERHTGGRTTVDSDRRDIFESMNDARNLSVLISRAKLFAEEQYNDAQFTLDGLREVIDNVAGIPGRKALLYVSDGIPMRAGQEVFEAVIERGNVGDLDSSGDVSSLRMQSFEYDLSARLRTVTSAANSNDITFYTLDAAGLLGRSLRGADMRSTDLSTSIESTWANNMQDSLAFLAADTGGQFAINTNNFARALDDMNGDFRDYYSLGYAPPHPGTGREYKIKVEVKNKRAKGVDEVRYANSYRDKSPEKQMQELTLAALQYGVGSNDIGVRLRETQRIRRSDGTYMVHVEMLIPLDKVTMLPRSEQFHTAKLEFWVQARDSNGDLSPPARSELPLTIPNADVPRLRKGGEMYGYTLPLQMAPGDQWISIGIRDAFGGDTSVVSQTFQLNE